MPGRAPTCSAAPGAAPPPGGPGGGSPRAPADDGQFPGHAPGGAGAGLGPADGAARSRPSLARRSRRPLPGRTPPWPPGVAAGAAGRRSSWRGAGAPGRPADPRWPLCSGPSRRTLGLQQGLAGVLGLAPFIYSNVSFRPRCGRPPGPQLRRHPARESGHRRRIRPWPRRSWCTPSLTPSSLGPRLKAISLSERVDRRAASRRRSSSPCTTTPAWRSAARPWPSSPAIRSDPDIEIRPARDAPCRRTKSVQLRLEALDGLAERKVDSKAIREAILGRAAAPVMRRSCRKPRSACACDRLE